MTAFDSFFVNILGAGNGDVTNGDLDDPFMQFLAAGGAANAAQREPSQDINRVLNQVTSSNLTSALALPMVTKMLLES